MSFQSPSFDEFASTYQDTMSDALGRMGGDASFYMEQKIRLMSRILHGKRARKILDFGSGIGFASRARQGGEDEAMKSTIQTALKRAFSPEFLNRIDDVIIFNSLQREHIHKIIDITLAKVFARINALGYNVELTDKAKDFLSEKGYDQQFGARPLNRAIQRYLEDPVAEEILKGEIETGGTIIADHYGKSDVLTVKVKKARAPREKKE